MTIFAGACSLNPNDPLPAELLSQLRAHVSRFDNDTPVEHRADGFFAVKVDIGAFAVSGDVQDADGSATVIAGEPLLSDGEGDPSWNRARDGAVLHALLKNGDTDALRRARGTYCGLHHDAQRRSTTLFVDKIGVRPLYLWVGPRYAVFSTALRVLEAVALVPKRFDVRGVTEIAAFAYAMADRTPYLGITMLKAGESVEIAHGKVARALYWRWDGPLDQRGDHAHSVKRSYDEFIKAIERRRRGAPSAVGFLSGGLDSRVIVGGLHASGTDLYTVNYAPDASQDQVFAQLVADKLGHRHTQLQTNAANVGQGYRKAAVTDWLERTFAQHEPAARPRIIWSGDGGSVGLGNVYMTPEIVGAMARGDIAGATRLFTAGLPRRIFKRSSLGSLIGLPAQGVTEELEAIDSPDPGRRFHLFLMFNDQRRHLARHFEDIDLERIEFELPFFDADFLESVLRQPNEPFMGHRFYMDWLAHFPGQLDSIPWQAYPGHVPCTLPSPPGLKYQWEEYYDKDMYAQMRRDAAEQGRNMLASESFPDHLISRTALRIASLLTGTGLRNYGYMIRTAATYQRYWTASDDRRARA